MLNRRNFLKAISLSPVALMIKPKKKKDFKSDSILINDVKIDHFAWPPKMPPVHYDCRCVITRA